MNSPSATNPGFDLKERVAALSETILSKHPSMPTLLAQIHKTIKQYPEQITILSEEDVQTLVKGLELQTQTFLVSQVTGSKKSSKSLAARLAGDGAENLL